MNKLMLVTMLCLAIIVPQRAAAQTPPEPCAADQQAIRKQEAEIERLSTRLQREVSASLSRGGSLHRGGSMTAAAEAWDALAQELKARTDELRHMVEAYNAGCP